MAHKAKKLMVAIPHTGDYITRAFTQNLVQFQDFHLRHPEVLSRFGITQMDIRWGALQPLDGLRDSFIQDAIIMGFEWIWWLDTDQVYPFLFDEKNGLVMGTCLEQLLGRGKNIIAPLTFKKGMPHETTAGILLEHKHQYHRNLCAQEIDEARDKDGLLEVDITGVGGLLTNVNTLRQLPPPWFEYGRQYTTGKLGISEDVPFCHKVRHLGEKIWLDTTIVSGHIRTEVVEEGHYRRGRATSPLEIDIKQKSFALIMPFLFDRKEDWQAGAALLSGIMPFLFDNVNETYPITGKEVANG
jgi:hypothetical protein